MKKVIVAFFSHSGNTKILANNIKENTGGDLFEIRTIEPYPVDYNAVVDKARKELNADYRPKLSTKVENMNNYDIIFIGYPNWCGTIPMGVFAFFEEYNFSGKTIMPFCTHEGSGLGQSERDIKKLCPNSSVLEGLAVRGSGVNKAQNDVSAWLRKLGIKK